MTQRRLTSLESDLRKAERRELERKNGGKYHMVSTNTNTIAIIEEQANDLTI